MANDFYFPIKPIEKAGLKHNVVRLGLQYDKRHTGPICYISAMERKSDGSEQMAIFSSPHASIVVERGWKTNNKKRMEITADAVKGQILGKFGPVYDAVAKLLSEHGSELLLEEAATV